MYVLVYCDFQVTQRHLRFFWLNISGGFFVVKHTAQESVSWFTFWRMDETFQIALGH